MKDVVGYNSIEDQENQTMTTPMTDTTQEIQVVTQKNSIKCTELKSDKLLQVDKISDPAPSQRGLFWCKRSQGNSRALCFRIGVRLRFLIVFRNRFAMWAIQALSSVYRSTNHSLCLQYLRFYSTDRQRQRDRFRFLNAITHTAWLNSPHQLYHFCSRMQVFFLS